MSATKPTQGTDVPFANKGAAVPAAPGNVVADIKPGVDMAAHGATKQPITPGRSAMNSDAQGPTFDGDNLRMGMDFYDTHQTRMRNQDAVDLGGADTVINAQIAAGQQQMRSIQNARLMNFQNLHPFLPITGWARVRNLYIATKAFDVQDIDFPNGAKAVRFWASVLSNFMVAESRGQLIDGAGPAASITDGQAPLVNPIGQWFYIEEMRSLSILLAALGTAVSVEFLIQI